MSQDIIQNLHASMPNRIAWCIRARGGSTREKSDHISSNGRRLTWNHRDGFGVFHSLIRGGFGRTGNDFRTVKDSIRGLRPRSVVAVID
ncbi:hypothetical protein TNCV_46031 [Trichonephila clavipes]|nr:hypothetical protein TNCV_46031 [Trichonephila clavipes]